MSPRTLEQIELQHAVHDVKTAAQALRQAAADMDLPGVQTATAELDRAEAVLDALTGDSPATAPAGVTLQ